MTEASGATPPDMIQIIGRELVGLAPEGWVTGTAVFMRVGNTAQLQVLAFDAQGGVLGGSPSRTMSQAFNTLREMLAQPGKGAFLTATYNLRADGELSVDFNYDDEPAFGAPTDPSHYVEELQQHPRRPEAIPTWWQERVAQAHRSSGAE